MKKRTILFAGFVSLGCGSLLGILCAGVLANRIFRNQAQLVSALQSTGSVYEALHQAASSTSETGQTLLVNAGYTKEFYFQQNVLWLCASCVALFLLLSACVLIWKMVQDKKRAQRIQGLTDYLTAVLERRERLLQRREDEFSQLEDGIYKTVSELHLTREQAIQERQTLADNLADIAHQLKTPLTSMRLLTELLSRQNPEDVICLERLDFQTKRLETLVGALLTLSRLDAGAVKLRREMIQISDLVLRAMEPIEAQISAAGIDVELNIAPEIRLPLDAMWTAEALLNVLKNCAEHTPAGGKITVFAKSNPIFTVLVITDSGSGFAKEDLPHLFERFYRGKQEENGGIGIGLALTQAILRAQDAEIRADCAPQGGARFTIKFYDINETR